MGNEYQNREETDAYVQELIRQVEAEGLLKAPAHMKQEILERSRRADYQLVLQTRKVSRNMQLFFYSLKVGAAVVMALFLLFAVPKELPQAQISAAPERQTEELLSMRLKQGLGEIDQMFTELVRLEEHR